MTRTNWLPRTATWALSGAAAAGAASVLGYPELAYAAVVGGAVGATGAGVLGYRSQQRAMLMQSLEQALAPLVGDRSLVIARRWKGWPGTPAKVIVTYDPVAKDGDPAWRQAVLDAVQRRLEVAVSVDQHDRRKRRLVMTTSAGSTANPAEVRVQRTIADLLGASTRVGALKMNDAGEVTSFQVTSIPTTKVAASGGYRVKVERTFGTVHQGRWRCKWDLMHDRATFEVRPPFPGIVELPRAHVDPAKDVLKAYDKVSIELGVDEDGNVLSWRPAIDPNLMVVGAPGTGKTVLEHSVLVSVAQYGWPIWIVDGKAIEFLGFRDWPNVQVVASAVEEQVAVITRAHEVMEHRYQLIVQGKASEDDFEPLMVFIDEWSDFRANLMAWYSATKVKGMPTKPVVLERVASIARKGRSSRVHLLFATQRPDAEYFGGDMRDNFRARASMGRLSPQGAMMMWQDPSIGTTVPRGCRGRATSINDDNRAVEIQTYWVPDPRKAKRRGDDEQLRHLDNLRPVEALSRHSRLLIVPPDDDKIENRGAYAAWCEAAWVPAASRPDLDPLQNEEATAQEARALASPMAMFGIELPALPASTASEDEDPGWDDGEFGHEVDVDPLGLSIGDLVEIEPNHWVTLDQEPEEDPSDPGLVMLCWRDDVDDAGIHAIPLGERIKARTAIYEEAA